MATATAACWIAWAVVLFNVDPDVAGAPGFALFYVSLFFSLLGGFFLLSFAIRRAMDKQELEYKLVGVSFRQSFFFAGLLVLALFLQGSSLLTWWNFLIIIIALTLVEFFFLSSGRNQA